MIPSESGILSFNTDSGPPLLLFVAPAALQLITEKTRPPLRRDHPRPVLKRRVVTNVLSMPALKFRYPMPILVLVETNNLLQHVSTPTWLAA